VTRGGADRDPAVEPLRVPAQHPAAELVRRRESGVGVERRDVDARRLAQQHERQERHERLVEVEQVEPLALEHVLHERRVARRDRDRADGPVGRHREALPEADDVAFGRALQAVRAGDDPHVVAAQPQVRVQVAHVLRHAAWQRIDVWRDEADLHPRASRGWAG
jgi:hypothetical protein